MAQTPNYKWPTPDDTGQVRQGASAMRGLGNAIDATVKAISVVADRADDFHSPVGANVARSANQATSSVTTDAALAMDTVVHEAGASGGSGGITIQNSGLYIVTGWMELGVGTGGNLQWTVKANASTLLLAGGFARTAGQRASSGGAVCWRLSSGTTLTLRYTTDAAMTITAGRLTAYRISTT